MLKSMRKHAKYFYFLFFLIIISFVFWGVGMDNSQSVPLAVVEGQKITVEQYWRAVDRMDDVYRNAYGSDYTDEMRTNVREQVLGSLLEEYVLVQAAHEAGIVATDEEVQEAITSDPTFQRNGVFSSDVYKNTLRLNRMTPSYYESSIRRSIVTKKMRSLIEDSVVVDLGEMEGLSGDPEIAKTLRQAMAEQKKQEAVRAYVNGLMKTMEVEVNKDLISS